MQNVCIIIIPIYKNQITKDEIASLEQCCKILNSYTICFVAPLGLECIKYKNIVSNFNVAYRFKYYSKKYFDSTKSYSKLMLKKVFMAIFLAIHIC